MTALKKQHVLLFAVVALSACQPKEVKVQVTIVSTACDPAFDPFSGVQFLRVRITGAGIDPPIDSVAPSGQATRQISIPQIPAGKARVIEVRGYDSDPTIGGKVLSMGKSLPIDVPDVIADPSMNDPIHINDPIQMNDPIQVNIFLRKVNAFTRPSSANAPQDCQQMRGARAGHAAALLKNGKVFISGGYKFKSATTERVSLSDAEFFNPQTNSFEPAPEMSTGYTVLQPRPKAFHTATLLPTNGQVLLWGGEEYTGGPNNVVGSSTIILTYDPDVNGYGVVPARRDPLPPPIARTQHSAAVDANGKVLIVGGKTRINSLVATDSVESFDPATLQCTIVEGVSLPRIGAGVAPVNGGESIAVAGGTDGGALTNEVVFFKWDSDGGMFKREARVAQLSAPGRRAPGVATLRDGLDLVVVGGSSDADETKLTPIASSDVVNAQNGSVSSAGPTVRPRASICTVQLPDGSVMAIGGVTVDVAGGPIRSDGSTELITSDKAGGATQIGGPQLPVPRYEHTCTTLLDGTVLVTGGTNQQIGATPEILRDAWIYQPAPTD